MKKGLLDAIICPGCGSSAFELHVDAEDQVEIRKGSIICRDCSRTFPVSMGIPDLLLESNDIIVREQKGWESIINRYIWKPLKFIQLFLLGGVLNLVAGKRQVTSS